MKFARFSFLIPLLFTALSMASRQSEAGFVPLPSNMAALTAIGAYTTVGDLNFVFTGYSSVSNGGVPQSAGAVNVSAINGPPSGFELTGAFQAQVVSQNDIAISYTVISSGLGISQVGLTVDGSTSGNGQAGVTESIYTDSTKSVLLGQLTTTKGTVLANLNGMYKTLFITKDIYFNTYGVGDSATLSIVDQTFYEGSVPEPASLALMGLGLTVSSLVARSRRKSRSI